MKPATMRDIEVHALSEYPKEACGLVVAIGRKEKYVPCRNVADDPTAHFQIHPRDYAAAEDMGTIRMVVHSHPDDSANPSPGDRLACEASGLPWAIVAVHRDPAAPDAPAFVAANVILKPNGYEAPLRGREFIFGKQDCYTLVQDYYSRELGIQLPDFERKDKFWERGEDLYMEHLEEVGFQLIPAPTQKGDVILMAIRSEIVNHAAVWLGEADAMLHHPYEHLSERVVYGGYWFDNTRYFARKVK